MNGHDPSVAARVCSAGDFVVAIYIFITYLYLYAQILKSNGVTAGGFILFWPFQHSAKRHLAMVEPIDVSKNSEPVDILEILEAEEKSAEEDNGNEKNIYSKNNSSTTVARLRLQKVGIPLKCFLEIIRSDVRDRFLQRLSGYLIFLVELL